MAMVSLGSPVAYPGNVFVTMPSALQSIANGATLDAAGEYIAVIFSAYEAMTISYVGVTVGSVAGSPTADFRIETVAADGTPSGTLWATNTNVVSDTLTNGWNQKQLTASASIVPGDVVAVKIIYNSGTSFIHRTLASSTRLQLPYQVTSTGGSAVKASLTAQIIGVGSASTTFYHIPGCFPSVTTSTNNNFTNATAGAKRGLRFQMPMNCRCVGTRFYSGGQTGDFNAILFDDGGSELSSSSTAHDGDATAASAAAGSELMFDNAVTLTRGTWYRLVLEPTSVTNVSYTTFSFTSAAYMSSSGWASGNAHLTTFTTAGGWIDTATGTLPSIEPLIDQVDDGTGTGGGGVTARVIGE